MGLGRGNAPPIPLKYMVIRRHVVTFIAEKPCVSNVVVSTDSTSQLTVTWDEETALCLGDEFQVEYEITDGDQCGSDADSPSALIMPWQDDHVATLTGLKAHSTYRVVVTPALSDGLSERNVGESVETYQTTSTIGRFTVTHNYNFTQTTPIEQSVLLGRVPTTACLLGPRSRCSIESTLLTRSHYPKICSIWSRHWCLAGGPASSACWWPREDKHNM